MTGYLSSKLKAKITRRKRELVDTAKLAYRNRFRWICSTISVDSHRIKFQDEEKEAKGKEIS